MLAVTRMHAVSTALREVQSKHKPPLPHLQSTQPLQPSIWLVQTPFQFTSGFDKEVPVAVKNRTPTKTFNCDTKPLQALGQPSKHGPAVPSINLRCSGLGHCLQQHCIQTPKSVCCKPAVQVRPMITGSLTMFASLPHRFRTGQVRALVGPPRLPSKWQKRSTHR